jgi:hypothetical protein
MLRELGIDRLSIEDRLALVQEIWESIAAEAEQIPSRKLSAASLSDGWPPMRLILAMSFPGKK